MKQAYNQLQHDKEATGERVGYYLVKGDQRYFISEKVNEAALNKVCDKVLSDKVGWNYWIDYSYGRMIDGNIAWVNIDQTDRFI